MPRSLNSSLVAHLARIEALARDLGRELSRPHALTPADRAMADTIKEDIAAVLREMSRR
jgi:hypothetical protein